jgi:NitT/TauT family transport system substrate-binding protein
MDKIALTQPGSIQHILLSMAAQSKFKNTKKFDNQLLTMNHPDAMNALLAKRELSAHFASAPYLFLETKAGMKEVLSGKEAFGGDFTFIIGVSTQEFYQQQPENYHLFSNALAEAISFIQQHPDRSAEILADNYSLSKAEMREYINWPGMEFSSEIKGLKKFIDFMKTEGYLSEINYEKEKLIFKKVVDQNEE